MGGLSLVCKPVGLPTAVMGRCLNLLVHALLRCSVGEDTLEVGQVGLVQSAHVIVQPVQHSARGAGHRLAAVDDLQEGLHRRQHSTGTDRSTGGADSRRPYQGGEGRPQAGQRYWVAAMRDWVAAMRDWVAAMRDVLRWHISDCGS